jgi:hypothetical protein
VEDEKIVGIEANWVSETETDDIVHDPKRERIVFYR